MVKIVRLTSIRAYLTLCYLSLTCSSLNSLNKSACLSAESGFSAHVDCARLVEKRTHGRLVYFSGLALTVSNVSEIWKYFAYVADSKGKPTDTTEPVCKRWFHSLMTKGANTSVSLCTVTVCHRETMPLWLQAVRKQRKVADTDAAPLSHKVHKVLILIRCKKKHCFNGWVPQYLF